MLSTPITVNYEPDGDDWAVEVSSGAGEKRTAGAPGLIAARDTADQLVAELTGDAGDTVTVVHLLRGDALAFTTAYMHARLGTPPAAAGGADSGATGGS
jgi:hypothetical protein